MLTGRTSTGFEFSIDEEELNNMEFVDALAEAVDDTLQYSKVVKLLLGADQRKALYDHVRTESGRVPIEAIVDEVNEIMESSAELKNS